MPTIITREGVRRLLETEAAQLVDVLPRDEYDEEHIAGALNLPIRELNESTAAALLDKSRPVITYCHDYL